MSAKPRIFFEPGSAALVEPCGAAVVFWARSAGADETARANANARRAGAGAGVVRRMGSPAELNGVAEYTRCSGRMLEWGNRGLTRGATSASVRALCVPRFSYVRLWQRSPCLSLLRRSLHSRVPPTARRALASVQAVRSGTRHTRHFACLETRTMSAQMDSARF